MRRLKPKLKEACMSGVQVLSNLLGTPFGNNDGTPAGNNYASITGISLDTPVGKTMKPSRETSLAQQ